MEEKKEESSFDKGLNGTLGAICAVCMFVALMWAIPKTRGFVKSIFNPDPAPPIATERE